MLWLNYTKVFTDTQVKEFLSRYLKGEIKPPLTPADPDPALPSERIYTPSAVEPAVEVGLVQREKRPTSKRS